MNRSQKTSGKTALTVSVLTLIFAVALASCSSEDLYDGSSWSETAMAVVGGTLLATEGNIHLVSLPPVKSQTFFDVMRDFFTPIPTASAQYQCPVLDPTVNNAATGKFECLSDGTLKMYYFNCAFPDRAATARGYWRTTHRLKFPDQTTCQNLINAGTISFTDASLDGETLYRYFGMTGGPNGSDQDEYNFRISPDGHIAKIFTNFPSGWYDSGVKGGVEIALSSPGGTFTRELVIKGIHAEIYSIDSDDFKNQVGVTISDIINGADFCLAAENATSSIDIATDAGTASLIGDQTMDTQRLATSGSGADEADAWEVKGNTAYDPIVVTGTGASKTITSMKIRTQHNRSQTIVVTKTLPSDVVSRLQSAGIPLDANPLSWANDASCCWPTQGEMLTNYYHTENMKFEFKSTLTKFTSTCGEVQIRYFDGLNAQMGQNDDSPKTHHLSQCY